MSIGDVPHLPLPTIGSRWEWEPLKPHARCTVIVADVTWNGEEWWVEARNVNGEGPYWNEWSRWVEAAVLVAPAPTTDGDSNPAVAGDDNTSRSDRGGGGA